MAMATNGTPTRNTSSRALVKAPRTTLLFGAVLSSRLAHYLAEQLAKAGIQPGAGGPRVEANNVQAIQQLTEPVKSVVLGAFTNALDEVFLVGVPFVAAAVVVALLLKEKPLRTG